MTTDSFIGQLPEERKEPMKRLTDTLRKHLPKGFEESANTMIHYVIPFSLYPPGYHCPPKQPLPFISVASQKNFIALYHMGLYADPELLDWFVASYPNHAKYKLDMGKSCIRFKKMEDIPYALIGELAEKVTPEQWVAVYESRFKP